MPVEHVYFPLDCVISVLALTQEERMAEVGTIGNEGMLGLSVFLGRNTTPLRSFCQIPGGALKMDSEQFRSSLNTAAGLYAILLRYTEAMYNFAAQSSACNRLHSVEKRVSRWLLHTHDRVGCDEFSLTQESLAQSLGVRRASVSEAARGLRQAGLIRYSRGRMQLLDRDGLEQRSCECYRTITAGFERPPGSGAG